jgi:hypothetical protein
MGDLLTVGWREWLALPDLGLPAIKAKVDTGAKTSALHAFRVEPFVQDNSDWVRFWIHPVQRRDDIEVECISPMLEQREVTDSGGHRELRFVIATQLKIAQAEYPIQITLTNRDSMQFRMLLGREAMVSRIQVDPGRSYVCGKLNATRLYPR